MHQWGKIIFHKSILIEWAQSRRFSRRRGAYYSEGRTNRGGILTEGLRYVITCSWGTTQYRVKPPSLFTPTAIFLRQKWYLFAKHSLQILHPLQKSRSFITLISLINVALRLYYSFGENSPGPTQLIKTLRLFIFKRNHWKIRWKSKKVAIFKSFFI